MTLFTIPLTNVPQSFQISLGGKDYEMTCKWNPAPEAGWVMDIADQVTNDPIVANVPLITGGDMLEGLRYLGIAGRMFVYTDGDQGSVPTLANLGVESNVYFLADADA